jgi:hypothetical protein
MFDFLCGLGIGMMLRSIVSTARQLFLNQQNGLASMEHTTIILDDGTGKAFDHAPRNSLPDGGDLRIITKDNATTEGNAAVLLTFTVEFPDGNLHNAQTVTTVRLFLAAAAAMRGRYPNP